MIYKFHLISDEAPDFKMEILIDADATFLKLRDAILDAIDYDKAQMDSFILCDDEWNKEKEVTLEDMGSDSDEDVWLMDDTPLSDLIEDEGQKLMFVFDYLTNRAFFMEMKEEIFSKELDEPKCKYVGTPPSEGVSMNDFEEQISKAASATNSEDFGEDFYGSDDYNLDELTEDGYGYDQ